MTVPRSWSAVTIATLAVILLPTIGREGQQAAALGGTQAESKYEGNSGTTPFVFTVSLSPASDAAVSLNFATASGSAKAVEDYDARSGMLAFTAGETSKTVSVPVKGDRKVEWQEVFYLNLSGAAGAFVVNSQGVGVVRNDDR